MTKLKRARDKYHFIFLSNAGELKEKIIKFPKRAVSAGAARNEVYVQLLDLTNDRERMETRAWAANLCVRGTCSELLVSAAEEALFSNDPAPKVYYLSNGVLRLEKIPWRPRVKMRTFCARFEEMKRLEAGWYDGIGAALSTPGLDRLAALFDRYYPADIPLPYLFPTPEGQLQAEWHLLLRSISLDIYLSDLSADFDCYCSATGEGVYGAYDLGSPGDWALLADLIRASRGDPSP